MTGFELPAETRRIRGWWLREAARHLGLARLERDAALRTWHVGQAAQARGYARAVRLRVLADYRRRERVS